MEPFFPNLFWQVPDGLAILDGRFPHAVAGAISTPPLIAHEWLFELCAAWAVRHGAYGIVVIGCALAAAATPLLAYALARRSGVSELAAGIVAVLAVGSRFTASALRPETFAVDLFALELLVLAGRGSVVWILPIVALWANLHASAVLAPIVAAIACAALAVARRGVDATVRRSAVAMGCAVLGTLATPHGWRLWSYAVGLAIGPNPARSALPAWAPLSLTSVDGIVAVLPGILIAVLAGIVVARGTATECAIAAAVFALTVMHARYAVFLSVAWSPVLGRALDLRTRLRMFARASPRAPVPVLLPWLLFALLKVPGAWRAPLDPPGPWTAAATIVATHHLAGNAYASYLWSAYFRYRALPVRVLIDGHGDPYPADVWRDHLALQDLRPGWRDVLARRAIAIVALPPNAPLIVALAHDPTWHRVDQREGVAIYTRTLIPRTSMSE